jgi:tetratricopeptide (TPR) repeat protein
MSPITFSAEVMNERYAHLIRSVIDLSDTYFYAGRLAAAVELPEQTLAFIREGDAHEIDRTRLLLHYGKMLSKMSFYRENRFDQACQVLNEAQQMARDLGDQYLRGMARLRLGQVVDNQAVFSGKGDFQIALNHFEHAYDWLVAAGSAEGQGKAAFNKGLIHQRLGELGQARLHFTEALEMAEKHDFKYDKSLAIRHIGFIHFAEGDLREEIGCRILLASAHHVLGSVSIAREEWAEAVAHLQQADALAEAMNLKMIRILTQLSLGEWYKRRDEPAEARIYFQLALQIAEETGHAPWREAAMADLKSLRGAPA